MNFSEDEVQKEKLEEVGETVALHALKPGFSIIPKGFF